MRTFMLGAALAASLVASSGARADDIVIAAPLILSGPYASYGLDARIGIDIAVEEINAAGGVLGRPLRIEYEDSGGDRAKAVALYQKAAATPEVVAALSISSGEFLALNPVSAEGKLPFISIGSVVPIPTEDFSPYAFRVNLIMSNAIGTVLDALHDQGIRRVAVIFDTVNPQTVAEAEIVRDNLEKHGHELTAVESFNTGEQNFTLQLTNVIQTTPDLLWVSGTTDEDALIISQSRALGYDKPIIGGAGLNDPRIGEYAGDAAQGVMTFALFNSASTRPAVLHFLELYNAKHAGQTPAAYVALGYDAIGLLADAITRAGSTDREAVRNALGETKDYDGVNGPFSYAGSGDNLSQSPMILLYGENGFAPITN